MVVLGRAISILYSISIFSVAASEEVKSCFDAVRKINPTIYTGYSDKDLIDISKHAACLYLDSQKDTDTSVDAGIIYSGFIGSLDITDKDKSEFTRRSCEENNNFLNVKSVQSFMSTQASKGTPKMFESCVSLAIESLKNSSKTQIQQRSGFHCEIERRERNTGQVKLGWIKSAGLKDDVAVNYRQFLQNANISYPDEKPFKLSHGKIISLPFVITNPNEDVYGNIDTIYGGCPNSLELLGFKDFNIEVQISGQADAYIEGEESFRDTQTMTMTMQSHSYTYVPKDAETRIVGVQFHAKDINVESRDYSISDDHSKATLTYNIKQCPAKVTKKVIVGYERESWGGDIPSRPLMRIPVYGDRDFCQPNQTATISGIMDVLKWQSLSLTPSTVSQKLTEHYVSFKYDSALYQVLEKHAPIRNAKFKYNATVYFNLRDGSLIQVKINDEAPSNEKHQIHVDSTFDPRIGKLIVTIQDNR
ncbi:hypothetical protein [Vibrio alginolyticus]|uniref:hypothetical protein n=1 Tax=Vibrio alginolyticus TaxID=663 RepID=UPI003754B109